MSQWDDLVARFKDAGEAAAGRARKEREEREERERFERWANEALRKLMGEIVQTARQRADEFEQRTGAHVDITEFGQEASSSRMGPWIASAKMTLGADSVYLYAAGAPGTSYYVHYLPVGHDLHQRLGARGGGFLAKRADGTPELHYLEGDPDGSTREAMPVDTLVFRAFDALVRLAIRNGWTAGDDAKGGQETPL